MTAVVFVISRGTGSNWMAVLSSGLLATLALSAILPALAISGARLQVRAPADATVGRPVNITVETGGRIWDARLRLADPPGPWVRVEGKVRGDLLVDPQRRGVVRRVKVELRSAAPLGLVWWRLPLSLELPQPMEVGPRPAVTGPPQPTTGDAGASGPAGSLSGSAHSDLVRTVRDYVAGDPLRTVSWTSTARHGRLLVKEMEGEGATTVTLVVDLRGEEAAGEEAASRAAGLALAALHEGMAVVLATAEADGGRVAQVSSAREVGRRLARAVTTAGPPQLPGAPGAVMRIGAGA